MTRPALYWEKAGERAVCTLCPKLCARREGQAGFCRARRNMGGEFVTVTYGAVSSVALDPIEKKPLYHFHPGTSILSLGTVGCNLKCRFCQNWAISQGDAPTRYIPPEEAVRLALAHKATGNSVGIAYTYSEPLVWYEYVLDTSRLAKERGLANVLVTNGVINEKPLLSLLPFIDAMNIDVKATTDDFYRKVCGGNLDPVLRSAELAGGACHVEITHLLIPTLNDSPESISRLAGWVADKLGPHTPLHLSRYHPDYKMDLPPTPIETLQAAKEIASQKLPYVYLGNVASGYGSDTFCHNCRGLVIERHAYLVRSQLSPDASCPHCGARLPIVIR